MLKILIVEDDMIIAADISMQLVKLGFQIIGMCTRGEDAINMIRSNPPDIVLMDIILSGKLNGIETAEIILKEFQTPLIFITSNYDEQTFQRALKTKPFAFIAKPFQKSELERVLKITAHRLNTSNQVEVFNDEDIEEDHISTMEDRLFLRQNGEMVKVFIDDILFVEADRNYCKVVLKSKKFFLSIPLNKFVPNLPGDKFLRTHRSFIVNLSKVDSIADQIDFLNINKIQIPVSRRQKEEVAKRLKLV